METDHGKSLKNADDPQKNLVLTRGIYYVEDKTTPCTLLSYEKLHSSKILFMSTNSSIVVSTSHDESNISFTRLFEYLCALQEHKNTLICYYIFQCFFSNSSTIPCYE